VVGALLFGSAIMVGGLALLGVKLTFVNFVAFPMAFGIGVDYSINIYQRYLQEGAGAMGKVLRRTGSAVVLCSLTTIIGYAVLIVADSRALVSLGSIAILGEFTCLSAAVVALPAMLSIAEQRARETASNEPRAIAPSGTA
jgi:predicted RND superfamily exporter protein